MLTLLFVGGIIGFVALCYRIQARDLQTEDKYKAYRKDGSKWVP
jgi:hypothetical protein